ncbi:Mov34/MPN/PAD-1 family protein [Bremerella cremea]|uniref:Mov34/MPN/PAD-1 family protein n=1 Tax=Bremerella cremea TaxID=1031537 RepID=UPI0031E5A160
MSEEFVKLSGEIIEASSLRIPRALALAAVVEKGTHPYVKLVECRRIEGKDIDVLEAVVFDVEVERPQRIANDIKREERIAVSFTAGDDSSPVVMAMREDFPRVSHTNATRKGLACVLCIYDQAWSHVVLRWTPVAFLEQIRNWLTETSKGTLHQDDQPLEALLMNVGPTLILPADFFADEAVGKVQEFSVFITAKDDLRVLLALKGQEDAGVPILAYSFQASPQHQHAIQFPPQNLRELHDFLVPAGIDLIRELRQRLFDAASTGNRDRRLLLLVAVPMVRDGNTTIEATDTWAFLTPMTIHEVGVAIDVWPDSHGSGLVLPGHHDENANGESIQLETVRPQFRLTRARAAAASGVVPDARNCVAIGAGSLGSHVVKLLVQSGFGNWTLVDEDRLLPHNIARHTLYDSSVGFPKAQRLGEQLLEGYYPDEIQVKSFEADIIRPGPAKVEIDKQLVDCDLIVDVAASIPVSRHLSLDVTSDARRFSTFMNPQGTDLVVIAEDAERSIPLDCLEMQYYRLLLDEDSLADHLAKPNGQLPYARSCRDVTSQIPNHAVAMLGAIACKSIRDVSESQQGLISIWKSDSQTCEVKQFGVVPSPIQTEQLGQWRLVIDGHLVAKIAAMRRGKLPVETGGVLLGSYDLVRKILYVVDTLPSPPDSKEWPTLYIRGSRGLESKLEEVRRKTDGQLEYVGEWHSHPDGCAVRPSEDDLKVFAWLTEHMNEAGLPALMAIAGEFDVTAWFLGEMLRSGGWETGI